MGKYVCTICGYIYDEAKGLPEAGIAPGTAWEDLPEDWVCPLCGATKAEFKKQGEPAAITAVEKKSRTAMAVSPEMKELSALELSALCSSLANGCEKQYKAEETALFSELAEYFQAATGPAVNPDFAQLLTLIEQDLEDNFPHAKAVASEVKDRGALRALTWSEKVTRILQSLLSRYQKEGAAMLENTDVYVCTICGFIYIGNNPPDICPVCKVPNWKFDKIEGGERDV